MPLSVVYDMNVLISAAGWNGPPRRCVELARRGSVHGVTCAELLAEFPEKLETRLAFPRASADAAVTELLTFLSVVEIPGSLHGATRDPDDDKVLECAVVAGAGYVVSGDRDLLILRQFRGIQIVRCAELLALVSTT